MDTKISVMRVRDMKNVMQRFIFYIKLILYIDVYIKYKIDLLHFTEVVRQ